MSDPLELVKRAFEMARQSGKADWRRMTTAVLKNRLLLLTQGNFRESDYGAGTFREFVELLGDAVRVQMDSTPWVIELAGDAELSSGNTAQSEYVRPDLWRAVLDYSSGREYLWDQAQAIARERLPGEAATLPLPTLSADRLIVWRNDFLQGHEEATPEPAKSRLRTWAQNGLPTTSLPSNLRGTWNVALKQRVAGILREWFVTHAIRMPEDAFSAKRESDDDDRDARLRALRQLVLECVAAMTEAELRDVRLPPAAILRARGGRG